MWNAVIVRLGEKRILTSSLSKLRVVEGVLRETNQFKKRKEGPQEDQGKKKGKKLRK